MCMGFGEWNNIHGFQGQQLPEKKKKKKIRLSIKILVYC